jgi:hypothetical protein
LLSKTGGQGSGTPSFKMDALVVESSPLRKIRSARKAPGPFQDGSPAQIEKIRTPEPHRQRIGVARTRLAGNELVGTAIFHAATDDSDLGPQTRSWGKASQKISSERVVWSFNAASQIVRWSSCLTRAIAGAALLRRAGYSATIQLGVAVNEGKGIRAHAWVECEGKPVLREPECRAEYTPLAALTSGERSGERASLRRLDRPILKTQSDT